MAASELVLRGIDVPPPLASDIHAMWELEGQCAVAAPQALLPDGCVSMVLNLGDPIEQVDATGGAVVHAGHLVIGEVRRPVAVQSAGRVHLLVLRFWPGGGQHFLEAPLRDLVDAVAGASALHARVDRAARRAADAPAAERAALVLAALQQHAPRDRAEGGLVRSAVRALVQWHGAMSIEGLAVACGVSRRQLERAFASEIGFTPKALADVLRFRRTLALAQQDGPPEWADLAAACGYFDQSHLIRDFRRFAGCTPRGLGDARYALSGASAD